tara:strand:- start:47 stop:415 length:369 start_codon:yes stop_codon:yes gene_type:complete
VILQKPTSERRRDPRVDNNIPIKIKCDNGDFVTETANISRSGLYCKVDSPVEMMTKMKICLLIPLKQGEKTTTKKVNCGGVVVRSDSSVGGTNLAIFFNDISQRDSDLIADYVSQYSEQQQV